MRLGIDLGGTAIKAGLVDEEGRILSSKTVRTPVSEGPDAILAAIAALCPSLTEKASVPSVGIGAPGRIDSENGVFVNAANLPMRNYPMAKRLSEQLNVPVFLENDANCALYGEIFAGAGRRWETFLLVTVGTGVGGGIRMSGGIYLGVDGRAGEFGHMTIDRNGRPCPCGRSGCWEQYASATALCRLTREAAEANPESLLAARIRSEGGKVDGKTVFAAARSGCPTAERVLNTYCGFLAEGINNLTVLLRPEAIVLAGGIFREGEFLLSRIRPLVKEPDRLTVSTLNGYAGLIGASLLSEHRVPESPVSRLLRPLPIHP